MFPYLRCPERCAQPGNCHQGGKDTGKHAQGTICYTTSPVHSIEQFVDMARQLADLGCDSIAVKDMAGLLTPMVTAEMIAAI